MNSFSSSSSISLKDLIVLNLFMNALNLFGAAGSSSATYCPSCSGDFSDSGAGGFFIYWGWPPSYFLYEGSTSSSDSF